jgi:hypothetical protein
MKLIDRVSKNLVLTNTSCCSIGDLSTQISHPKNYPIIIYSSKCYPVILYTPKSYSIFKYISQNSSFGGKKTLNIK